MLNNFREVYILRFSVSCHISTHLSSENVLFCISRELPDLLILASSPAAPHPFTFVSFLMLPAASDVVVVIGELWKQPDSLESISGK